MPYARLGTMVGTELAPGIVVDPTVRLGRPVIRGTRVPVDVLAALAYAAKVLATKQVRASC